MTEREAAVKLPSISDIATFTEVRPPSRHPPKPMAFSLGAYSPEIGARYTIPGQIGSLGVYQADRVTVTGPLGLQRDGQGYVCPTIGIVQGTATPHRSVNDLVRVAGHCVTFGPGYRVWGHWLVDHLPKLYLLSKAGYDLTRLSVILPQDAHDWADKLLMLVGLRADQIIRYSDAIEAEHLLIPTMIRRVHAIHPILSEVREFLLERIDAPRNPTLEHDRLYLPRDHMQDREMVEAIAKRAGFVLVRPQLLSIPEQVAMFHRAKVICGEYGSALHNSLFSEPGTIVCGFKSTAAHPGFVQSGIGDTLSQPTGYVFGEAIKGRFFRIEPNQCSLAFETIEALRVH